MKNLYCKVHRTANGEVLACCDAELLGKNLVDEKYDVTVHEDFYKGEKVSGERLAELLSESGNINLFGKNTILIAVKQGFISESDIIRIAGVEHAIIFKV